MARRHQWLNALAELVHAFDEIVESQHDTIHTRYCRIQVQHLGNAFIRPDQGTMHSRHAVADFLSEATGRSKLILARIGFRL